MWRLENHSSVHDKAASEYKYFLEGNRCPFEVVGCKFLHDNQAEHDNAEKFFLCFASDASQTGRYLKNV